MSESSSDTDSSSDWTIISHEGLEFETLLPNNAEVQSSPVTAQEVLEVQKEPATSSAESSVDSVLEDEPFEDTASVSEEGQQAAMKEHVTECLGMVTMESSKVKGLGVVDDDLAVEELHLDRHKLCQVSDIPNLESQELHQDTEELYLDSQELHPASEDLYLDNQELHPASEELYLDSKELHPARKELHVGTSSQACSPAEILLLPAGDLNSSEDKGMEQPSQAVQRHRPRRIAHSESEHKEKQPPHSDELGGRQEEEQLCEATPPQGHATPSQGHASCRLHTCLLLVLVIAVTMAVGHFYCMWWRPVIELPHLSGNLQTQKRQTVVEKFRVGDLHKCLEEEDATEAQRNDLSARLKWTHPNTAVLENQQLKSSLEREEESMIALQKEIWTVCAQIRHLEERGSENLGLRGHLEEERQHVLGQKEAVVREEQEHTLSRLGAGSHRESHPDVEELQNRLAQLQEKLSLQQRRSGLWEGLYVKNEHSGSDEDRPIRASNPGNAFNATKNSSKAFVHCRKEQIRRAKVAVKENLRKFSNSIQSTFQHPADEGTRYRQREVADGVRCGRRQKSAREQGDKSSGRAAWNRRKPPHRHTTRSSAGPSQPGRHSQNPVVEGRRRVKAKVCSGVFDCAYQDSVSIFKMALGPIQSIEFHQLIQSYVEQEVDHFRHWGELESFINCFFHNGVFIHDQMLFTDFVSALEDYLEDMEEYQHHQDEVFEDLDEYVYRHFFRDTYSKSFGPRLWPVSKKKGERPSRRQRNLQWGQSYSLRDRKWSRPGHGDRRQVADVEIELGPVPLHAKS